jgi:hypothetical protein
MQDDDEDFRAAELAAVQSWADQHPKPTSDYYSLRFSILEDQLPMLAAKSASMGPPPPGFDPRESVLRRLGEFATDNFEQGFVTLEAFEALPHEKKMRLITLLHQAALLGIRRFPE